jgi:hypothetical protein
MQPKRLISVQPADPPSPWRPVWIVVGILEIALSLMFARAVFFGTPNEFSVVTDPVFLVFSVAWFIAGAGLALKNAWSFHIALVIALVLALTFSAIFG